MTVLLAVLVVGVAAVAVAYPLWKPGPQAAPDPIGPAARLAGLQERKLQLYAAIRELGFDYRTDKLEEADYEEEVERVKAEAIAVVRQIDEIKRQPPRGSEELEAEIAAFRQQHGGQVPAAAAASGGPAPAAAAGAGNREVAPAATKVFGTQCGGAAAPGDRFCGACGSPLRSS
jgi:hypothetical protein